MRGFYKLTTVAWVICSMSERMLGNTVPMHSCLLNGRRSKKTKQGLQYLWTVFRHVGMWCWVLSTSFASLLILTYNTYVWQQKLSDERDQIIERKSCFPPTWASSTQTCTKPSNHRNEESKRKRERKRERGREREICQVLCKSLLVIFTKVLRYLPVGFMQLKETVSKWKSGSIQPKVANYGLYCFKKKEKKM